MLYFNYATIAANPWEVLLCSVTCQEAVHMDTSGKREKEIVVSQQGYAGQAC